MTDERIRAVLTALRRDRRRRETIDSTTAAVLLEGRTLGISYRTLGEACGLGHETVRRIVRRAELDVADGSG